MTGWYPGNTGVIDKGFGGSRAGNSINGAVLHHTANGGGKSALDYVANANSRNSHPTYLVQTGGQVYGIVHPDRRPYSTAGRPDPEAITFEIDNSGGAPDWAVSDAALSSTAAVIAYHYRQSPKWGKGIARNRVGVAQSEFFVAWHSQYVATACPGPWILARLDALIAAALTIANNGGTAPTPPPDTSTEERKAQVRKIGTFLNGQGLAAFRTAAADDGIPIDPGETYSRYYHLVQLWGAREGIYDTTVNSIDGIVGPNTRRVEGVIWTRLLAAENPKPSTPPVVGDRFLAALPFKVYGSAANARSGTSPAADYQAGTYVVFKTDGTDAVNVSKTAGVAGGWTTWAALGYPEPGVDEPEPPVVKKWTVTFDPAGGSPSAAALQIEDGKPLGTLPVVTRDGYTFAAWLVAGTPTPWPADAPVTANLALVAAWTAIPVPPTPAELYAEYLAEVRAVEDKYKPLFAEVS